MKKLLNPKMDSKKVKTLVLLCIWFAVPLFFTNFSFGQGSCTINAGGNALVCGSSTTLTATTGGSLTGTPVWSFISGPVTPVIATPNNLVTNVTGMSVSGNYVFQISHECTNGTTAVSQITITARPKPASFTAGPDITSVCATVGSTSLSGVIPAGFTGQWRSVNIYSYERFSQIVSTNSQFNSTTSATPVFSLINKANHEIDPSYYAILRITSADGCFYDDTAVVRFKPNVQIQVPTTVSKCRTPGSTVDFFDFLSGSPMFNTNYPGSAGTVAAGTTVTLNVISQPSGANMVFNRFDDTRRAYFTGMNINGTYQFTLRIVNSCGDYTTPTISYTYTGTSPRQVLFQMASHPEQYVVYSSGGSGGELHCNTKIGSTASEAFYFNIDPLDDATVITTTVTPANNFPPGGAPTVVVTGTSTANRVATVTPPAGGWSAGTYKFSISTNNGSCGISQSYYIHVSDGNRPNVSVANQTVCYPGTGSISATINLPAVYQQVVNSSYFQDFSGVYNFNVVSKPAGSAVPTYTATNGRTLTSTQTTISNLDRAGDYVFSIAAAPLSGSSVGPFLTQEYACSGASLTSTFTIRVENRINANAGSDQDVSYEESAGIAGNSPGAGSGMWRLVSYPAGTTPVIASPTSNLTSVSGLTKVGVYELEWTITSPLGSCVSSDRVQLISSAVLPVSIIDFDAARAGNIAVLNWKTASETNNKGFEVERSTDGVSWLGIGFIESKANGGNSSNELAYTFNDHTPDKGMNYYRLRQTDVNGKVEYSAVRQLNFGNNAALVKLYPNPAKTLVKMTGVEPGTLIRIDDISGKTVLTSVRTGGTQETWAVNISALPKGTYMIIIMGKDGSIITRKLLKD
ncbi:T9SS type A sorting domain-containing protein [Polluticaenibacter yanchengensis]|uniref:T9SS type A sorting domain-containing protein n=1 Tax=Polluticaenibacter yanchengensis TaxID=3014562 RepID=A0ABT4UL36_9BACT|nr:T9SS type A sorting domain-containing protein [Chitinophagaceae bacterium LY-5]